MKKIIAQIKAYLLNLLIPSTSELVRAVGMVEGLIDQSIDKQIDRLSKMTDARAALDAAIQKADADINTAYKLLHRVSGLTQ